MQGELAVELEEDLRELLVLEESEQHWEDLGEGEVGWFEAAMFCSAPLCCHVVSPTHTTLLLSVWKP